MKKILYLIACVSLLGSAYAGGAWPPTAYGEYHITNSSTAKISFKITSSGGNTLKNGYTVGTCYMIPTGSDHELTNLEWQGSGAIGIIFYGANTVCDSANTGTASITGYIYAPHHDKYKIKSDIEQLTSSDKEGLKYKRNSNQQDYTHNSVSSPVISHITFENF